LLLLLNFFFPREGLQQHKNGVWRHPTHLLLYWQERYYRKEALFVCVYFIDLVLLFFLCSYF
jgi:hypothetical protein